MYKRYSSRGPGESMETIIDILNGPMISQHGSCLSMINRSLGLHHRSDSSMLHGLVESLNGQGIKGKCNKIWFLKVC